MPDQTKGCADGSCSMQNAETRGPQIHYVPNVSVIYRGFLALYHSVTSKDGSRDAAIEELQNLIKIFNGLHDTEALTPEFMIKLCADFKELLRVIEEDKGERYKQRQAKAVEDLSRFLRKIINAYRE